MFGYPNGAGGWIEWTAARSIDTATLTPLQQRLHDLAHAEGLEAGERVICAPLEAAVETVYRAALELPGIPYRPDTADVAALRTELETPTDWSAGYATLDPSEQLIWDLGYAAGYALAYTRAARLEQDLTRWRDYIPPVRTTSWADAVHTPYRPAPLEDHVPTVDECVASWLPQSTIVQLAA